MRVGDEVDYNAVDAVWLPARIEACAGSALRLRLRVGLSTVGHALDLRLPQDGWRLAPAGTKSVPLLVGQPVDLLRQETPDVGVGLLEQWQRAEVATPAGQQHGAPPLPFCPDAASVPLLVQSTGNAVLGITYRSRLSITTAAAASASGGGDEDDHAVVEWGDKQRAPPGAPAAKRFLADSSRLAPAGTFAKWAPTAADVTTTDASLLPANLRDASTRAAALFRDSAAVAGRMLLAGRDGLLDFDVVDVSIPPPARLPRGHYLRNGGGSTLCGGSDAGSDPADALGGRGGASTRKHGRGSSASDPRSMTSSGVPDADGNVFVSPSPPSAAGATPPLRHADSAFPACASEAELLAAMASRNPRHRHKSSIVTRPPPDRKSGGSGSRPTSTRRASAPDVSATAPPQTPRAALLRSFDVCAWRLARVKWVDDDTLSALGLPLQPPSVAAAGGSPSRPRSGRPSNSNSSAGGGGGGSSTTAGGRRSVGGGSGSGGPRTCVAFWYEPAVPLSSPQRVRYALLSDVVAVAPAGTYTIPVVPGQRVECRRLGGLWAVGEVVDADAAALRVCVQRPPRALDRNANRPRDVAVFEKGVTPMRVAAVPRSGGRASSDSSPGKRGGDRVTAVVAAVAVSDTLRDDSPTSSGAAAGNGGPPADDAKPSLADAAAAQQLSSSLRVRSGSYSDYLSAAGPARRRMNSLLNDGAPPPQTLSLAASSDQLVEQPRQPVPSADDSSLLMPGEGGTFSARLAAAATSLPSTAASGADKDVETVPASMWLHQVAREGLYCLPAGAAPASARGGAASMSSPGSVIDKPRASRSFLRSFRRGTAAAAAAAAADDDGASLASASSVPTALSPGVSLSPRPGGPPPPSYRSAVAAAAEHAMKDAASGVIAWHGDARTRGRSVFEAEFWR